MTPRMAKLRSALPQLALLVLLPLAFALGGSPRGDIMFAVVLQTGAVLGLGVALAAINRAHLRGYGLIIALALGAVLLPALQLVPLPPAVWQGLPGRALIAEIDAAAGLGPLWRPLTMTPPETLGALLAATVPLAVLLLAVQLPPRRQARLVLLALGFGAVSAVMGLLQLLGDPQGPLYLFEVTNNGAAVGLFANRNHQAAALACMIPLAFAAASVRWSAAPAVLPAAERQSLRYRRARRGEWRMPLALAAACVLVPLILITGSRAGLMMGLLALASLPLVLPRGMIGTQGISRRIWLAAAALLVAGLAGAAIWLDRDLAIDRLLAATPLENLRIQLLPVLLEVARVQWVWGTGLGSFERLYQIHEPAQLLLSSYVNHAHNDWLELVITGGLPAILLLAAGLLGVAIRFVHVLTSQLRDPWQPLRRAAAVCLAILSLASVSDYPLRTPHLAALFALCALWLFMPLGGGLSHGRHA